MLLEPTPIDPRPDRGRLRAIAAAVAVVGVLVAVVALGVLDPSRPADVAVAAHASPVASKPVVASAPVPSEPVPSAPDPSAAAQSTARAVAPPWSRFGLDPSSVPMALAEHARSGADGRPIVVLGWLSVRPERSDCRPPAPSPSAEACPREGVLSAAPAPTLGWRAGVVIEVDASVDHLQPVFPPGIDLGGDLPSPPPAGDGMAIAPHPVVLIGRFALAAEPGCGNAGGTCSDPFVVDQMIPITDPTGIGG